MKNTLALILLGSALTLTGCLNFHAVPLGAQTARAPIPAGKVRVYRTAVQVPGRYEEIAVLSASGPYLSATDTRIFEKLRVEAAQLGANAIILDGTSEPSTGMIIADSLLPWIQARRAGKAIAIVVSAAAGN